MSLGHKGGGRPGQAAVETAIVMPTFLFFTLGIIQLAMMHHARLALEYAAFTAARVGSVWNADPKMMKDAALFTLVPTFGITNGWGTAEKDFGLGSVHGAQDLTHFAKTYGTFLGAEALSKLLPAGLRLVRVDILNPTVESLAGQPEIDFDDPLNRLQTQLTVRVVYLYNLRIPFANWIIFQSYMGQRGAINFTRRVDGWYLGSVKMSSRTARETLVAAAAKGSDCQYSGLTTANYKEIGAAALAGIFLVPMVTTYTIRMESSPLLKNLSPRSQVFPGC